MTQLHKLDEEAQVVVTVVEACRAALAGQPLIVQLGALTQLLAMQLSGFQGEGRVELRQKVMAEITLHAWDILPAYKATLTETQKH